MANCITRHIPNTLTCLNLFSGCIACVMAFEARYEWALAFIIFSAVFDFFDGMMARALDAHSIIGKDLEREMCMLITFWEIFLLAVIEVVILGSQ